MRKNHITTSSSSPSTSSTECRKRKMVLYSSSTRLLWMLAGNSCKPSIKWMTSRYLLRVTKPGTIQWYRISLGESVYICVYGLFITYNKNECIKCSNQTANERNSITAYTIDYSHIHLYPNTMLDSLHFFQCLVLLVRFRISLPHLLFSFFTFLWVVIRTQWCWFFLNQTYIQHNKPLAKNSRKRNWKSQLYCTTASRRKYACQTRNVLLKLNHSSIHTI